MTSNSPINPLMPVKNKKIKILQQCRICGASAKYCYFGVISCHPCKMFFKRNANAGQAAFVCHFGGQCEININNRHICQSCRLAKCFICGMSTDRFQVSRQIKSEKNTSVKKQVQHQPKMFPTLNLLRKDQSLLTSNQWTLLTNLFHCYKESQILPFSQRLIDTHDVLQSNYVIYQALVDDFLGSIYKTVEAYLCSNDDFRKLSSNDRSIMLRSAADNLCCMSGAFIMHHCHLYGLDAFLNVMNVKFGKSAMDIHIWARKFVDPDIVLVKLSISLFAFSENTCCYYSNSSNDLTNPIDILDIQNKYAEVTWKYLLFKYGYHNAVKRFLNITLWLASMNIIAVHAQSLPVHVNNIDSLVEQTELTLILDDMDQTIETK